MTQTIIQFKAKPTWATVAGADLDGWVLIPHAIKLPRKITRKHIIKVSKKHDGFINSDMLPALIARDLPDWAKRHDRAFDVNHPPEGVTVEGNFIKTVTITL